MPREKSLFEMLLSAVGAMGRLPTEVQGQGTRNPVEARVRRDLAQAAHDSAERQLTWGSAGCISSRIAAHDVLLSKAGSRFESVQPGDLMRVDLSGSAPISNAPSGWPFHRAIYLAQPEAKAIIQLQPPYGTALSIHSPIQAIPVPEIMAFWAGVQSATGQTEAELAQAIGEASLKGDKIIIERRGVICWARSIVELVPLAAGLESASRLIWLARRAADE